MPNGTATLRGLALLSLLVLSASGCDNNSSAGPTPKPPPPPAGMTSVRLEGRVLDEHNQPVENVGLTAQPWLPARGPAPGATTDDTGSFSFTLDWQTNWAPPLSLDVRREGYEPLSVPVSRAEASRALLINIYKSLAIGAGESIQATVSLQAYPCGMEPLCRRVGVNATSGKPIDIEVVPADGQPYAGLALADQVVDWYANFPSRVTVSGGDSVWIAVRQPGRVNVIATGR